MQLSRILQVLHVFVAWTGGVKAFVHQQGDDPRHGRAGHHSLETAAGEDPARVTDVSAALAALASSLPPRPKATPSWRWPTVGADFLDVGALASCRGWLQLKEATLKHGPLLCGVCGFFLLLALRSANVRKQAHERKHEKQPACEGLGDEGCDSSEVQQKLQADLRQSAHTLSVQELEAALHTQLQGASLKCVGSRCSLGLDEAAALEARETFGRNALTPPERENQWLQLLKQIFGGLFNVMLWLCVACELVLVFILRGDDIVTPIVLSTVIVASATLQWWTELQAEGMMTALQGMQASSLVAVHRSDGAEVQVPAEELVPGDVVVLEAGQRVPADVRILACSDGALVENSALTGESAAEPRTAEASRAGVPLLEARNVVFCGTSVVQGRLLCVVYGTGDHTMLGQIAAKIRTARPRSSLEIQIEHFVHLIAFVAIGVGLLSLAANLLSPRKRNLAEVLENAATAFFAQVPEGLLPTVTVCLMIASKKMARRKVLVRKIDAVETLGCIGVLCSDKTGTLTSGKMTATDFAVPLAASADGLLEVGVGACANDPQARTVQLDVLLRCGLLNTAARPDPSTTSGFSGSPTEVAIVSGCAQVLGPRIAQDIRTAFPQVFEIPFNSTSKWMLTIHACRAQGEGDEAPMPTNFAVVLKGAPERVLDLCDLDARQRASADQSLWRLMGQGKRVLCLAEKRLTGLPVGFEFQGSGPEDANFSMEGGFAFCGLVALEDPPKEGAAESVARIARAGARTVMVTGDHPATAEAIARRLGLIPLAPPADLDLGAGQLVVTGAQLEARMLGDDTFADLASGAGADGDSSAAFWRRCVQDTCVFARVSPMHKRAIVQAYQKLGGQIVAMTGDGVNDAPALKEAEVGIAMGVRGTEVAKEASDIVLLDDDLRSVVHGIEQGRLCSENLRKSILYTLCSKLPQVLPTFAELVGVPSALTAAQVLLIDIGTDIWTAIAFAWQPPEGELMRRPPRHPRRDRMVNMDVLLYSYGYLGIIQSASCWFVFFLVMPRMFALFAEDRHPSEYSLADSEADFAGMTAYYWTLVLGQVGAALACTTTRQSALSTWAPNRWLTACIVLEILLALLVIFWRPMQSQLKTRGLSLAQLAAGLLGFAVIGAAEELRKFWLRRCSPEKAEDKAPDDLRST